MELPSYASFTERHARIREALQEIVASKPESALAWCAVPHISGMSRPHAGRRSFEQRSLASTKQKPLRELAAAADPASSAGYRILNGCLSRAGFDNHRRSQDPAFAELGWKEIPLEAPRVSRRQERRLTREAGQLGDEITGLLGERGLDMPIRPSAVYRYLFLWARQVAVAEALVKRQKPRIVVIGATPSGPSRPLVHFAREAGIPSVYIPHAPCKGLHLEDLPVDYAALRGPREVDHFAGLGVDRDRLDVGGNAALPELDPVEIDAELPPILAMSAVRWEMSSVIDLARDTVDVAVVAPHPILDREALHELCPEGWEIWPGRTLDLLKLGPPAVVQPSSGVALEAMLLGVPTIELAFPGLPAPYPFIREPYLHLASSSEELAGALAAARAEAGDPRRRDTVVDWAMGWSSPNGTDAATQIANVLRDASSRGPRGPIWDDWATGHSAEQPG